MAENSREMDLGDLVHQSFDFKHVAWKVPNVLSLPNLVDYNICSSTFPFAGATWRLAMYPFGESEQESEGFIDLKIIRWDSRIPEHHVFYKFCFKTRQGKEFESYSSSHNFNSDFPEMGVKKYIKKSIFLQKKNIIAPNGVLTIVCELRTKGAIAIDKHSQMESSTTVSGVLYLLKAYFVPILVNLKIGLLEEYLLPSFSQILKRERDWGELDKRGCSMLFKLSSIDNKSDNKTELKVFLHLPDPDNKILSDFKDIFLKQEDCDVIIRVKGKEFSAHRLILKARSPVFASTFRNDMKEKSAGIIDIEDCDPGIFSNFLNFLYSGDIENLTVENVFSLFTTSDKYDVQDLRKKCLEFIKDNLSVDTFCDAISLAVLHSETELLKLSTDFFAENLQDIIVTVKWQVFLAENPTIANELFIETLAPNKCSK